MTFRVTKARTNAREDHTSFLFRAKETSVLPMDGVCSFRSPIYEPDITMSSVTYYILHKQFAEKTSDFS